MTGRCFRCHKPTATRTQRPKAPWGSVEYRVGFVRESRDLHRLICLPCIVNSLPANVI